jgi:hypothetical protein
VRQRLTIVLFAGLNCWTSATPVCVTNALGTPMDRCTESADPFSNFNVYGIGYVRASALNEDGVFIDLAYLTSAALRPQQR